MASPLLDALAEALRHSDDAVVPMAREARKASGRVVGAVLLRGGGVDDRNIPVFLAPPEYWQSGHGPYQRSLALAEALVAVNGDMSILINHCAYDCGLSDDPTRRRIAEGLIAHEAGHVEAGHLWDASVGAPAERVPDHLLDSVDAGVWLAAPDLGARYALLAAGLLEWGCYPQEIEADGWAIALVGAEPVLALLAHQASSPATTLVNRMEFGNRIARHFASHRLAPPRARRKGHPARRLEWGFMALDRLPSMAVAAE